MMRTLLLLELRVGPIMNRLWLWTPLRSLVTLRLLWIMVHSLGIGSLVLTVSVPATSPLLMCGQHPCRPQCSMKLVPCRLTLIRLTRCRCSVTEKGPSMVLGFGSCGCSCCSVC